MEQSTTNHTEAELNTPANTGVQQDVDILPLSHLMAQNFPPVEWLVQDLIPEDAVVLLSAPPASFKTWFALELAKSIASGAKFLDKFTTKPANILIMDAESGDRQLHDHFKKLHVDSEANIYYADCCSWYLNKDSAAEKLGVQCYENDINLIIFDSLVRFHDGDENSSKEMSKVFRAFSYLKKQGITSLILHHTRKGGVNPKSQRSDMEAIRGSGDILAACDIHLCMNRANQGNKVFVKQTKNRLDTESKPFSAYFIKESNESSRWYFGEFEESKEDIVKRQIDIVMDYIQTNPGRNQKQILTYLQLCENCIINNDKPLRDILKRLEEDGQIYSTSGKGRERLYYAATLAEEVDNPEEPLNV